MALTTNQRLADQAVRRRLFTTRYGTGQANKMMRLLRDSRIDVEVRLRKALEKLPRTAWSVRHDQAISRALLEMLQAVYANMYGTLETDLKAFSASEAKWHVDTLRGIIPVQIQAFNPVARITGNQVFAAATANPFQGALLSKWADAQASSLTCAIAQQVRMGYIQGETTEQLVKRVNQGAFNRAGLDLAAVTKSAVAHFASEAREEMARQNADLIKARQWLSTLDSHTSKLCIVRDNLMYTADKKPKPIGHPIPYGDGPGRLHFCCRSTETWVIKSWKELGIDADELSPGTRASMDGQVPADMNYVQWLKRQPQSVQERVLGVNRAAMLQHGANVGQFFNDKGEFLTLDQLARKEPDLFPVDG